MRIMLVIAANSGDERREAAIDLDQVMFAHDDEGMTLAYSATDVSIKIDMPFEEFLDHWSSGSVIRTTRSQDPMTKSTTVEDVMGKQEEE